MRSIEADDPPTRIDQALNSIDIPIALFGSGEVMFTVVLDYHPMVRKHQIAQREKATTCVYDPVVDGGFG